MNSSSILKVEAHRLGTTPAEWERLRVMTDEDIAEAALADPDAQPLTDEQLASLRRPSFAQVVRQTLRMNRQTFAATYGIELEALIAWERHQGLPSQAEHSYLLLIDRQPELAKRQPAN